MAYLRQAAPTERPSARVLSVGASVSVTLDGHLYEGRIYQESSVLVKEPGKPMVKELYVLVGSPWQLTDEAFVAKGTYIVWKNGACELRDLVTEKAAAEAREAYVKKAIADVDAAVKREDWAQAEKIVAEARARYPQSKALGKRAAKLTRDRYYAVITVENRGRFTLHLQLREGLAAVVDLTVRPSQKAEFEVKKGTYSGRWTAPESVSVEQVTVTRPEKWIFALGEKYRGPAVPSVQGWNRWVERLGQPSEP